uniref:Cilia- and flagella-associated protein 299 n=1 Tax=Photinus pyralis TaxID=7054 RepID=A0A1Y1NJQ3_PHOPY
MVAATPQIEADQRLLQFKTYEDYLDSLTTSQDICNLQSVAVARTLAELGYRSSAETLSRASFQRRLGAVLDYLYPTFKAYELSSEGIKVHDPLQQALALRERPNRIGVVATIIFVRYYTPTGFEVSGYIDYAHRLKLENWKPFFKSEKKFWPRNTDLGYCHWRSGKCISNGSLNYKVVIDPEKGLTFQNRFDRKVVCADPAANPGIGTTRIRINTDMYEHIVLYDHVVRRKV